MRFITKILLISSAALLVKCGSLPKAPGEPDFAIAQKRWSGVKMEDLTQGHLIYTTKCNKCHGLKKVDAYDEATWGKLIDAMAPEAKLTTDETEKLRKYIYAAREAATK